MTYFKITVNLNVILSHQTLNNEIKKLNVQNTKNKKTDLMHFKIVFVSCNFSHLTISFPVMQSYSSKIIKGLIQVVSHHALKEYID